MIVISTQSFKKEKQNNQTLIQGKWKNQNHSMPCTWSKTLSQASHFQSRNLSIWSGFLNNCVITIANIRSQILVCNERPNTKSKSFILDAVSIIITITLHNLPLWIFSTVKSILILVPRSTAKNEWFVFVVIVNVLLLPSTANGELLAPVFMIQARWFKAWSHKSTGK